MNITNLNVNNFRNIKELEIKPSEGINIIFGENAQGKTNALEAVYLFSIGKSFRTQQDRELIRFHEEQTKISVLFENNIRENEIELVLRRDRKKQIKIKRKRK